MKQATSKRSPAAHTSARRASASAPTRPSLADRLFDLSVDVEEDDDGALDAHTLRDVGASGRGLGGDDFAAHWG